MPARWRRRPTVRSPIMSEASCCARKGVVAKPFPEYETAISLDRSRAPAYAHVGWCKFLSGSMDGAIPYLEQAIHLSPHEPGIAAWYGRIGVMQLLQGDVDEALLSLERARSENARLPFVHAYLAAAYATIGRSRPSRQGTCRRAAARHGLFELWRRSKNRSGMRTPKSAHWPKRIISRHCAALGCRRAAPPELLSAELASVVRRCRDKPIGRVRAMILAPKLHIAFEVAGFAAALRGCRMQRIGKAGRAAATRRARRVSAMDFAPIAGSNCAAVVSRRDADVGRK